MCFGKIFESEFLFQALCGTRVEVPTLSGDRILLDLQNEVIKPTTVRRVPGRGMPMPKDATKRGDLLVSFDIVFPEKIPATTRDYLRNTLPVKWTSGIGFWSGLNRSIRSNRFCKNAFVLQKFVLLELKLFLFSANDRTMVSFVSLQSKLTSGKKMFGKSFIWHL